MYIFIIAVLLFAAFIYLFMRQPQFGKPATGARLQAMQQSPNYKNGQFQNINPTPQLTEDANMLSVMKNFFLGDKKKRRPPTVLPSEKTDLHKINADENVLVWFGHSSYFMQIDGKKILVDPVFSGDASPIRGANKSFPGSDVYNAGDMPEIDYLIITHDHWDHLDYPTVKQLKPKVKKVITTLGVGAHLELWGYNPASVIEGNWKDEILLDKGFTINLTSARHFSGRTFKRNITLWAAFVLTTPSMKIYIGGDSGYDTHFAQIGEKFGPFDIVILENGQYNKSWKYIHMMPEEVVQAAIDLRAQKLLPVHWSKFALSLHDWDEPIRRVVKEAEQRNVQILHPMIGQELNLKIPGIQKQWWEQV